VSAWGPAPVLKARPERVEKSHMAISKTQGRARRTSCGIPILACAWMIGLAWPFASSSAAWAGGFAARIVGPDQTPVLDAVVSLAPVGVASPDTTSPKAASTSRSPAASPPRATMDQVDLAFVPHVLAVATGTVVDFPNSDQVRHSLYSFSAAKTFEVKLYRGFEAPPIRFEKPGLVVLGCNIHDHMLGFVYVLDAPHFAISDETGALAIPDVAAGRYRLELRHPRLDESVVVTREIVLPEDSALTLALEETPPPRPAPRTDFDPLQSLFGEEPAR